MLDSRLLDSLASAPEGLRFGELIAALADAIPAAHLVMQLNEGVALRKVAVRYEPTGTGYDDLRFQVITQAPTATGEVASAILHRIRMNVDSRGDFTNNENIATLYPAMLRKFTAADVDSAVSMLISEEVLTLWGLTGSRHLWLEASPIANLTVIALGAAQTLACYYVRAGTVAAAERKLRHQHPEYQVLGVVEGLITVYEPGTGVDIPGTPL